MSKKTLILMSGGLDSAFMFHRHIDAQDPVDREGDVKYCSFLYVDVENNPMKSRRERVAVDKIREYAQGQHPYVRPQVFVKTTGIERVQHECFQQMPVWFGALFEYANAQEFDEAHIGYLADDDCGRSIPYLIKAWDALWMACRPLSYENRTRLVFPLQDWNKRDVMNHIPDELAKLTTSCESQQVEDHCGFCLPCRNRFSGLLDVGKQYRLTDDELRHGMSRLGYAEAVARYNQLKAQDEQ